jgi:hypothetical protein
MKIQAKHIGSAALLMLSSGAFAQLPAGGGLVDLPGLLASLVPQFRIEPDGTAVVRGFVLQNERHCDIDATCSLGLEIDKKRISVIYGQGPHPNKPGICSDAIVSLASRTNPGDLIEARGSFSQASNLYIIDLCTTRGNLKNRQTSESLVNQSGGQIQN